MRFWAKVVKGCVSSALLVATIVLAATACGAAEERMYVATATDDGIVEALTYYYPEGSSGFLNGGAIGSSIGVLLTADGDPIRSRALYRLFNISARSDKPERRAVFHGYCSLKQADPGEIEAYLVKDFEALPETTSYNSKNVSFFWNLSQERAKVGAASPSQGDEFRIEIPADSIPADSQYIALLLKASNEAAIPIAAYSITSYESPDHKPYISWEKQTIDRHL